MCRIKYMHWELYFFVIFNYKIELQLKRCKLLFKGFLFCSERAKFRFQYCSRLQVLQYRFWLQKPIKNVLDISICSKFFFLDIQQGSSLIDPVLLQEET